MEKYLKYYDEIDSKDTDSFRFKNSDNQNVTVNIAKTIDGGVSKWVRAIVTEKNRYLVKVDKTSAEQKEEK